MLDFLKKKNTKTEEAVTDEVMLAEKYYQEGTAKLHDLIAPSAIKIAPRYIRVGETLAQTIFVVTYPRYLHSNWFSPIINIDMPLDIAMFVHPIDTTSILKTLRKSATQVQSQIHIEQEKGLIRDPTPHGSDRAAAEGAVPEQPASVTPAVRRAGRHRRGPRSGPHGNARTRDSA